MNGNDVMNTLNKVSYFIQWNNGAIWSNILFFYLIVFKYGFPRIDCS